MIEVYMTFETEEDWEAAKTAITIAEEEGEISNSFSVQVQVVDDMPWGA